MVHPVMRLPSPFCLTHHLTLTQPKGVSTQSRNLDLTQMASPCRKTNRISELALGFSNTLEFDLSFIFLSHYVCSRNFSRAVRICFVEEFSMMKPFGSNANLIGGPITFPVVSVAALAAFFAIFPTFADLEIQPA